MQQPCGDHEGQAVEQGIAASPQFGAMGMAMEHHESGNDQHRQQQLRPQLEQHHQAHHQARDSDPDLHARNWHPEQAQQPPEGHHQRKRHRHTHRASGSSTAPQRPTATIATT